MEAVSGTRITKILKDKMPYQLKQRRGISRVGDKKEAITPYRPGIKICIERPRLITESYKETEGLPMVLRRAKALAHILDNMTIWIGENERIAGEWMMCAHGIKYDVLKDPFIAFDYFTANNERMLHSDLISKTANAEIETPRIIFHGFQAFRLDWALEELNGNKHLHTVIAQGKPEGLVYRVERKGKFDYAAKFVRQDHECGIYIIDVPEDKLTWNVNPNAFEKSKAGGQI